MQKLCDWLIKNWHQRTSRDPIGCLKYIQHIHTGHLHHFIGLAQWRSGPLDRNIVPCLCSIPWHGFGRKSVWKVFETSGGRGWVDPILKSIWFFWDLAVVELKGSLKTAKPAWIVSMMLLSPWRRSLTCRWFPSFIHIIMEHVGYYSDKYQVSLGRYSEQELATQLLTRCGVLSSWRRIQSMAPHSWNVS